MSPAVSSPSACEFGEPHIANGKQQRRCLFCGFVTPWLPLGSRGVKRRCVAPATGPGTELKALLAELNVRDWKGCQCESRARQMNAWGVAGCRQHRGEIVAWLREAAAAAGWLLLINAALHAAANPWFNPLDGIGSIVNEAIRRAEAAAVVEILPILRPAAKRSPFQYISTRKMADDTIRLLLPQIPPNVSAIAGVPRSGMLPAAILATQLQLPLLSVNGEDLVDVGSGSRGRQGWAGDRSGPVLIVDDSVYGGGNMRRLRSIFRDRALYAAMYVRPELAARVDFFARALPSPHLFEWNLFNGAPLLGMTINPALHGGIALDFDGVICHDPNVPDSNEAAYTQWMANARPLQLPRRHKIPLIVTFRLEKYRELTLAWLARWGVSVDRLVMHPASSAEERNRSWNTREHKGDTYRHSPCRLFIESDRQQAIEIHQASGKPVLCLATEEIFQ